MLSTGAYWAGQALGGSACGCVALWGGRLTGRERRERQAAVVEGRCASKQVALQSCCAVLCCIVLCSVPMCSVVLCYTVLCCDVLCCVVVRPQAGCCVVLYSAVRALKQVAPRNSIQLRRHR